MRVILKDKVVETNHVKVLRNTFFVHMPNFTLAIFMDSEGTAHKKMIDLGVSGFVDCTRYSYEVVK